MTRRGSPGGLSLVDAHCDLASAGLPAPASLMVRAATARGVRDVVMAGTDPLNWGRQRHLAGEIPRLHCTFGWHPWWVSRRTADALPDDLHCLETALGGTTTVAIGEIGLDFSRPEWHATQDLQREALRGQLDLARARDLPVVLHVVRAHGAVLDVLRADGIPDAGGVVHGYTGSPEGALEFVALGLHLSFSASVTRPEFRRARRACAIVPDHRLLIETDAPDQRVAGSEAPGEPADLVEVARCVSELRAVPFDEIAALTSHNARELFRLSAISH